MAADGAGIAVWIPPDAREEHEAIGPAPPGAEDEILGDHADLHAAFWEWVGEHEPQEPLSYLSHIGVAPERQGEGIGTALMHDGLASADRDGVAAWLETSKATNAAYYEGFGFRTVVDEDAPDGGPHIWFMRRDPSRCLLACNPWSQSDSTCSTPRHTVLVVIRQGGAGCARDRSSL